MSQSSSKPPARSDLVVPFRDRGDSTSPLRPARAAVGEDPVTSLGHLHTMLHGVLRHKVRSLSLSLKLADGKVGDDV
jgi:hypothetical protein